MSFRKSLTKKCARFFLCRNQNASLSVSTSFKCPNTRFINTSIIIILVVVVVVSRHSFSQSVVLQQQRTGEVLSLNQVTKSLLHFTKTASYSAVTPPLSGCLRSSFIHSLSIFEGFVESSNKVFFCLSPSFSSVAVKHKRFWQLISFYCVCVCLCVFWVSKPNTEVVVFRFFSSRTESCQTGHWEKNREKGKINTFYVIEFRSMLALQLCMENYSNKFLRI